eukprot:g2234.t1
MDDPRCFFAKHASKQSTWNQIRSQLSGNEKRLELCALSCAEPEQSPLRNLYFNLLCISSFYRCFFAKHASKQSTWNQIRSQLSGNEKRLELCALSCAESEQSLYGTRAVPFTRKGSGATNHEFIWFFKPTKPSKFEKQYRANTGGKEELSAMVVLLGVISGPLESLAPMGSLEASGLGTTLLICSTLVTGTGAVLLLKMFYQSEADGLASCGGSHHMHKIYFNTFTMFSAEAVCLLVYYGYKQLQRYLSFQDFAGFNKTVLGGVTEQSVQAHAYSQLVQQDTKPLLPQHYFAFFAFLDLISMVVSGIGLIIIDASIYSMLRGSQVLFTALVSICLLKARYSTRQIGGLFIVCCGLALVIASGAKKPSDHQYKGSVATVILGLSLTVLASFLWSLQSVLEEKYMKKNTKNYHADPLQMVGWEGFWGTLMCIFGLLPAVHWLPGSDCGSIENTLDTLAALQQAPNVLGLLLAYSCCTALFRLNSVQIASAMTAVHRQLATAARTIAVWCIGLVMHYYWIAELGESWTKTWSLVQATGFVAILLGTVTYGHVDETVLDESDPLDKQDAFQTAAPWVVHESEKIDYMVDEIVWQPPSEAPPERNAPFYRPHDPALAEGLLSRT